MRIIIFKSLIWEELRRFNNIPFSIRKFNNFPPVCIWLVFNFSKTGPIFSSKNNLKFWESWIPLVSAGILLYIASFSILSSHISEESYRLYIETKTREIPCRRERETNHTISQSLHVQKYINMHQHGQDHPKQKNTWKIINIDVLIFLMACVYKYTNWRILFIL